MGEFVKVTLKGVASGKQIRNILYWGNDVGESLGTVNEAFLDSFLAAFAENIDPDWGSGLADSYNCYEIEASVIDERGTALDVLPQALAVDIDGARAAATDTVGLYGVVAMKNMAVLSESARSLRRSYIAYGPLTSTDVDGDGLINAGGAVAIADALVAISTSVVVGSTECTPVRIGRTTAPAQIALGQVVAPILRPYASFRRSRLRRPTGA